MSQTTVDLFWTQWSWEPSILLGLGTAAALYLLGVFPLRRRFGLAPPVARGRIVVFLSGLFVIFIALVSPLDFLADMYVSGHMTQHLLLTIVMPPLLLAGTPGWLLRPLLWSPGLIRAVRYLTQPVVTFGIFNVNFYLWHWPWLYQLSLVSRPVHILMHLLFMATGLLLWWQISGPLPELRLQSYPLRIVYLFAQALADTPLSLLLIFSPTLIYPAYALTPKVWTVAPLTDQQAAGLIMWIPGSLAYVAAASVLFFRWFNQNEMEENLRKVNVAEVVDAET